MEKKSVSVKNGDKEITLTGFSEDEVKRILNTVEIEEQREPKKGVEIKEQADNKSRSI